jgi:hypothetical protein
MKAERLWKSLWTMWKTLRKQWEIPLSNFAEQGCIEACIMAVAVVERRRYVL